EAGVDHKAFVTGHLSKTESDRVESAIRRLEKEIWPRMRTIADIEDRDGSGWTSQRLFRDCNGFRKQVGATRVMAVFDMFDDLPVPKSVRNSSEEHGEFHRKIEIDADDWRLQQILELSRLSKRAVQGGWPIILIGKLRKSVARNQEPTIDDLLGGVELANA